MGQGQGRDMAVLREHMAGAKEVDAVRLNARRGPVYARQSTAGGEDLDSCCAGLQATAPNQARATCMRWLPAAG